MAFTPHKYDDAALPELITAGLHAHQALNAITYLIQERTGIPGIKTDINSDDATPGVMERLEMINEGDTPVDNQHMLYMFKSFDEEDS